MAESLRSFGHALRTLDKVEVYPNERNVPPDSFDLVIADEPEDAARSARVVQAFAANRTISEDRLEAISYGESRPVEPNDTAEGRAKNRRIEIEINY